MLLGTFQYMAPEQLEGKPTDARTDIFAYGALLYEMATGKRAFEGASRVSVMTRSWNRSGAGFLVARPKGRAAARARSRRAALPGERS